MRLAWAKAARRRVVSLRKPHEVPGAMRPACKIRLDIQIMTGYDRTGEGCPLSMTDRKNGAYPSQAQDGAGLSIRPELRLVPGKHSGPY